MASNSKSSDENKTVRKEAPSSSEIKNVLRTPEPWFLAFILDTVACFVLMGYSYEFLDSGLLAFLFIVIWGITFLILMLHVPEDLEFLGD